MEGAKLATFLVSQTNAEDSRSTASTRLRGASVAIASAIAPLPEPKSTTIGLPLKDFAVSIAC